MEEHTLPVTYRGQDLEFPLRIVSFGFGYRFAVLVNGLEVIYEKDEQGELRALLHQPDQDDQKTVDAALLAAIGETITSLIG